MLFRSPPPAAFFSPTSVLSSSNATPQSSLYARRPDTSNHSSSQDNDLTRANSAGATAAKASGGWAASSRFRMSPSKSPLEGASKPAKPAGVAPGSATEGTGNNGRSSSNRAASAAALRLFVGQPLEDAPSTPPASASAQPANRGAPRLQASAPGRMEQQVSFRRGSSNTSTGREELKDADLDETSDADDGEDDNEWSPKLALHNAWPQPPGSASPRVNDNTGNGEASGVRM